MLSTDWYQGPIDVGMVSYQHSTVSMVGIMQYLWVFWSPALCLVRASGIVSYCTSDGIHYFHAILRLHMWALAENLVSIF